MQRILFFLFFYVVSVAISARPYLTCMLNPNVRTLRVCPYHVDHGLYGGDPERPFLVMSESLIGENGDANKRVLEISFDDVSGELHPYSYTVLHLDRNYEPDELISSEYLTGFTSAEITDYAPSFNTSRQYTHYRFLFPNADMALTISGNYAVIIYESGYPERVVAIQNVWVVEPQVTVETTVRSNTDIELYGRYQQLDITLSNLQGSNVVNDYFIRVRQNNRTDNEVVAPHPTYVESNRLRWSQCRDLIFEAGNEFRHLDIFSQFMAGNGVERIVYDQTDYHAELWQTPIRSEGEYMHEFDANGQYLINAERTSDVDIEAEYMWVHFRLFREDPWFDGSVYVGGEWNDNRMDYRSAMTYNNTSRCYELAALMKQGGYDFQYWFLPKGEKRATLLRTEGSHWQTSNEYRIFVYQHPFGARYDRLVGIGDEKTVFCPKKTSFGCFF